MDHGRRRNLTLNLKPSAGENLEHAAQGLADEGEVKTSVFCTTACSAADRIWQEGFDQGYASQA